MADTENFDKAVASYREVVAHDCTNSGDCPGDTAFFIMARMRENEMEIYSGGHRVETIMVIQTMVEVIDSLVAQRHPELSPMHAFMKSRDLIHSAADGVDPSPDASADFHSFAQKLGDDDE